MKTQYGGYPLAAAIIIAVALFGPIGCTSTASAPESKAYSGTSDPEAIGNARSLLRWLYSLPQRTTRRVLSGQEIGCYDGPQGYYDYARGIERRTGKLPALIETDYFASIHENFFIDAERKTAVLRRHWEAGGLVALHLNFGNPWTGGAVDDMDTADGRYSDLYTPGTEAYAVLKADVDRVADQLLELQNHEVVVLFRPFHEVNGGWFWWYSPDPREFKAMWRHWHTYLREARGVHNLLWVYSPSPLAREHFRLRGPHVYYPGDAYVDINALDLYEHDLGDRYRGNYTAMVELAKPFGFGELGSDFPPTERNRTWSLTNISQAIETHYPQTVFWLSWSSWEPYGIMAMEQLPDLERLFAHPLIASIEDVDFRRVVPEGPSPAPATEPGAEAAPSKVRVGFVDCSPGYVLGSPDYFETAARAVAEQFRDTVEIVPVRGLYTYRIPNAVDRLIGEENCSIVVFDDHDEYSEYVQDCARRYPEVTFIVPFDEHLNRCPNVRTFGINSEGWYYLTGMAAGAVSETGRIGYVAHSEAQWNVEHATEFTMGVAEVNPDAEVLFTASGGRGAEAVRHLVSQGCDVLNGVANSAEVIRELRSAAERGELICAFSDALPRTVSPEVIAAGLPEDLGEVYSRMLGDILAGRDVDHPYWSDIRSGVVRIDSEDPPFSPRIRGILESAPAPGATAGGPSVYELILSRHRALERGELRVEPERYRGFHPMIRRVSLPD